MSYPKPIGWQVTVKLKAVEEKTAGGIIQATNINLKKQQESLSEGTIMAKGPTAFVGPDYEGGDVPEIGDKVSFVTFAGTYDKENGSWRVMADRDIRAILEDEK